MDFHRYSFAPERSASPATAKIARALASLCVGIGLLYIQVVMPASAQDQDFEHIAPSSPVSHHVIVRPKATPTRQVYTPRHRIIAISPRPFRPLRRRVTRVHPRLMIRRAWRPKTKYWVRADIRRESVRKSVTSLHARKTELPRPVAAAHPPMRKSQASPPVNTLIFMGMTAPPSKAALMEREIHSVPNDIVTRTKLLGYEYVHQFSTPVAAKKFDNLALWFIARHPGLHISGSPYLVIDKNRAPAAYAQGSRLWKQAVHKQPRDVNVLANAAAFFTSYDSQEAALLLMQASYLDPKSVTLHNKLGTLYALRAERYPASSHVDAVLALAELQRAQDLSHDPTEQYEKLQPLAFMAMEAGNTALAARYARRMLHPTLGTPGVFPVGNSLHDAYIILGRVALKQNNALQAEAYLMAASQVPLSPDLKNFGPNMSLARDFLLRGKPKPVLRYFEACELFWHDQRLALWKTMIQSGKIPKFGPNLWY